MVTTITVSDKTLTRFKSLKSETGDGEAIAELSSDQFINSLLDAWEENDRVTTASETRIPCGCGSYAVLYNSDEQPDSIDVVCPKCGNHFGYGDGEISDDIARRVAERLEGSKPLEEMAFEDWFEPDYAETIASHINAEILAGEMSADLREQLDRIEAAASTAEERTGQIQGTLDDLGGGR